MKQTQSYTIKMTGKEAADLILSGVYVRRVGVVPADPNLYLTIRHLYDRESSVLRNVWTGQEKIELWDRIEFA
jgi:hypothetical protein